METLTMREFNGDIVPLPNLSVFQKLHLRLFNTLFFEKRLRVEAKQALSFYIIRCKEHGFVVTYPSGFHENLICPQCLVESVG